MSELSECVQQTPLRRGSDVHADTMVTFLAVEVADAMLDAAKANDCEGRVVISSPSATGVVCVKEHKHDD